MNVIKIILACLVIYTSLVGLLWMFQERIAFPAPRRVLPDPATMGIHAAERISVTASDDVELFGWYLSPDPEPEQDPESGFKGAPALIWFYGNYETVSGLAPVLRVLRPPGWGVLAIDIRGYGESGGKATEEGFYRDAEAAWDFIVSRPEIDSSRIAVHGRSLGTALALHLAASRPVAAVVLEAPFTSGGDLARKFYWWLPRFAVRLKLDNVANVRANEAPLLVLHGADDEIVPLEMGRAIAEAGHAQAFHVFDGAGHNEMLLADPDRYRNEWMTFLESVIGLSPYQHIQRNVTPK
jgi:dipeptidyl aminopeptidase/acylaminoacyl peptidase